MTVWSCWSRTRALLAATLAIAGFSLTHGTGAAHAAAATWCNVSILQGTYCGPSSIQHAYYDLTAQWGAGGHPGCDMNVAGEAIRVSDGVTKYYAGPGCNGTFKTFPNNTQTLYELLHYGCNTCADVGHTMYGAGNY